MRLDPVAKVYSKALFETALEVGSVEKIQNELKELCKYFAETPSALDAISSRSISLDDRVKISRDFSSQAGLSPTLGKLVEILVSKSRLNLISDISAGFDLLLDQKNGIVRGFVTTTEPLSDAERADLAKTFSKKTNKQVVLNQMIDKSILGGLIVNIDGLTYDGSLKTAMRNIKENLERQ